MEDPSEKLIQTHLAALKWHMQSRKFEMTAETLQKLQHMSVSLIELLKTNLPEKSGEVNAWKFEKAHSILHKVRELILFGWYENFSTQGPEHCHIDFCKKVAACTNNKDVFLCILRHHVREGHLQYLQKLQADLACEDESEAVPPTSSTEEWLGRNDSISCELGIRYPVLQAILSGRKNHQSLMVRAYETGWNSKPEIIMYTISYLKRSWQCPADTVLPQREPSQHYSSFFASCSSRWRCC